MRRVPAIPLLTLAAMLFAGCALDDGEGDLGDSDEVAADGKADGAGELRTRIDGLTVWIDPVARMIDGDGDGDGETAWQLEGRASRNLAAVSSWVPDDAFGAAEIVGKRGFRIRLDSGHEQNSMLSGLPLFVSLTPVSGEPAEAAIWLAPRMARFAGSSKVYLDEEIAPVWVGGEVRYRGAATIGVGWSDLAIATPADTNPQVIAGAARRFRLDWSFPALAAVAALPGAPVHAFAYRGDEIAEKTAAAEVVVSRLGLTRLDPRERWPIACEPTVTACLAALPAGTADAGACGSYREVEACGGLEIAVAPSPQQLATDLRDALVGWYADHGADVVASGGNDLAAAQAAVDPAGFSEVTLADEDPFAHDLAAFRIYRHRDVAWPGSDIAWFLAYERASGTLVEVYDFN